MPSLTEEVTIGLKTHHLLAIWDHSLNRQIVPREIPAEDSKPELVNGYHVPNGTPSQESALLIMFAVYLVHVKLETIGC